MRFVLRNFDPEYDSHRQDEVPVGARLETVFDYDRRTCATPEEFDEKHGHREGPWRVLGDRHRILVDADGNPNGIERRRTDRPSKQWVFEIDTLNELLTLVQRYGDVTISARSYHDMAFDLDLVPDFHD